MNSAEYVDKLITQLKGSGIPLSQAAWETALACVGWPYTYGARGKKVTKDGITVRTFDCRGFTYWVLLQIYGWELMGAGCTSQWDRASNWKAKGNVKDGIPQDVIVCLFYYKKDDNGNRTSTLEHTGFYYNGETCECSKGVQRSKTLNKKWEVWGVPACVKEEVPTPSPPENPPTLRKGDRGTYVTLAQTMLINKGYSCGDKGADGIFGNGTLEAVKRFQRANGLKDDGVIGPLTWGKLQETELTKYTVTIPHLNKYNAEELIKNYPGATMTEEG